MSKIQGRQKWMSTSVVSVGFLAKMDFGGTPKRMTLA